MRIFCKQRSTSVRRSFFLLTIFLLSLTSEAQLTWHLVDNGTRGIPVPAARRDAAIGYDGTLNKLVLFGGRTIRNGAIWVLGDTMTFDLSKGTWQPVATGESPQPRFSMVYGSSEYYLYIAMGQGHNKVFYNDIWRFDMRSDKWLKLPEQKRPSYYTADHWAALESGHVYPEARYGAGGGIFVNSTQFFVSLGAAQRQYGDTYSYRVPEMGWYLVSPDKGPYQPFLPHPRSLHAAVMISKSELLIFGGCLSGGHTGGPCPAADSWIFDARTLTWKKQTTCATPRTMASLAMLPIVNEQRRVVLYGGEEEGPGMQVLTTIKSRKDEVAVFNPDSGVWVLRRTSGDIPAKKASVSMVTGRTGIYMFGGYDIDSDKVTNDLYLLRGDSVTADTAPVLAECNPTFFNLLILHGILMTLAWGLFLPWGAFIARYCRRNEPLRYNLHRLFQIFGLLLCVAGFICGLLSVIKDHFKFVHAIVGLITTIVGLFQPLNAYVRPSLKSVDKKMASRYFVWRRLHTVFGGGGIGLGLVNVSLGLFLAHSHYIIWIVWYSYLGLLILCHLLARINTSRTVRMAGKEGATSGQENARYIVTDIVPASELPAELFETINRNKCEETL